HFNQSSLDGETFHESMESSLDRWIVDRCPNCNRLRTPLCYEGASRTRPAAGARRWARPGWTRRWSATAKPSSEPDGRLAPVHLGAGYGTRPNVRIHAIVGAGKRPGKFQIRGEGVLHLRHGEWPALQNTPRGPKAGDQLQIQRAGSGGADASQRLGSHV